MPSEHPFSDDTFNAVCSQNHIGLDPVALAFLVAFVRWPMKSIPTIVVRKQNVIDGAAALHPSYNAFARVERCTVESISWTKDVIFRGRMFVVKLKGRELEATQNCFGGA